MNNQFTPPYYPYTEPSDMWQRRLNDMTQQTMGQGQQNAFNGFTGGMQMMQGMQGMGTMMTANQNQVQQPKFNVRPVSSIDEAFASPVPYDGSISVMTDFSNKRIYTKRLNLTDGTALMETFERIETPKPTTPAAVETDYVKREEFDEIKRKIDEVWTALTEPAPAKPNAKKEGK